MYDSSIIGVYFRQDTRLHTRPIFIPELLLQHTRPRRRSNLTASRIGNCLLRMSLVSSLYDHNLLSLVEILWVYMRWKGKHFGYSCKYVLINIKNILGGKRFPGISRIGRHISTDALSDEALGLARE